MTELIHATDAVVEDLKKVLENQGIKETSLRIDANAGWGGVSFYLALDEPAEHDQVQTVNGIQLVVSQQLINMYKGFTLESVQYGDRTMFRIRPQVQPEEGGCSSCTSCG